MKSLGTRYTMLSFRVSEDEMKAYEDAAKKAGMERSKWARLRLNKAVEGESRKG